MKKNANNNNNNNNSTAFADAMQNNLRVKGAKMHRDLSGNNYATTIDSATNRKVAIVVIDSDLRGFKQNARAIYNNRANMAVARYLAEKRINSALFKDSTKLLEYIKQYGARYIDKNGTICHESVALSAKTDKVALYSALGYEIRYNEDETRAVALIPARAWSVAQFINMVAHCRREEMKSAKIPQTDATTAQAYLAYCLQGK